MGTQLDDDKPKHCPYTWEKCWLMTIKGEGICKGCKHGEYAIVEKCTIKKLDAKVSSNAIIPENVIIKGKNSDSRCQITGKPCEMIATAGFRWCDGCKIYNDIMGTEVKISNIPRSVSSRVPAYHKKVGLWDKIRNLFR